ncbi:hypothetical protein FAZ19_16110 [Sphingobacterium alkalisoli]|uniref:Uncharacterized protein n=1 Tax=Sphingobacterium alkalisoli TaxID=1874115 RepID=A0A4U0GX94_9SPHI|nr:hypothetical protein [Sphingobacterium alkalisoli]TJY63790.1 hypothetical protein FAZ19_16110 [Sphingobacterium alkalisoli]GGH24866.1 hypothetical protein GCM10011418_33080 [Sphingobacterium alkalisoli]
MDAAFFEVVRELERVQKENERLKKQLKKPKKRENVSAEDIQEGRSRRWAELQYQRLWDEALASNNDRISNIRKKGQTVGRPYFVPINNCMDSYGKDKKVTQINDHANDSIEITRKQHLQ